MTYLDVADVAVDASDNVFILTRYDASVLVYDRGGEIMSCWGQDVLSDRPHGLTVAADHKVYITDEGDHTVRCFTVDGIELAHIGISGTPSETGIDWSITDFRTRLATMTHGGAPFNRPTKAAVDDVGDIYVSDGYGNARVHRFSAAGELTLSWGEPGSATGEFRVPHSVLIVGERVLVADRENDRIQVFSKDGSFLEEWTHLQRPSSIATDADGLLFVGEMSWRAGDFSWTHGLIQRSLPARVSILSAEGDRLGLLGGEGDPCAEGHFASPHGVAVDSRGDLYVAEVTYTNMVSRGLLPADCHNFQKLERVS